MNLHLRKHTVLGYLPLCRTFFYINAQEIGSIPPYNSFFVFHMQIQQLLKELDGEFLEVFNYTISFCSLYMSLMENFFQIGVNLKIVKIICFFFLYFFHWYPALDLIILKFSLYTTLEDIEYHNPMLKTCMILSKCAPNLYNELDARYCRLFFVLKTWLLVPFGKQWIQGSPIWKQ